MRKPLISGNWKMHHDHYQAIQVTQKLSYQLDKTDYERVEVVICPPFTDLRSLQTIIDADSLPIALGAQNCHFEESGAFTGEISPVFLAKLGVRYVIVGHSERRSIFGESDAEVAAKFAATVKAGLTPILCVGETLHEREAGVTEKVVSRQLEAVIGHLNNDGHLGRCFRKSWHGNPAVLLSVVGYKLRPILRWFRALLRLIAIACLATSMNGTRA